MNRKQIILHLWDTTYDVEGWHPPLKDALQGVSSAQALWRAGADAHNIWELINHIICYKDRFVCRLEGRNFDPDITDNELTFQRGLGSTEAEWLERLAHLAKLQRGIRNKIDDLTNSDLDKPLPDTPASEQIISLTSHDSYHTGQIMFIRKLQASWPSTREV
ncbi:MAG TPA: DinB family protein [Chryseolinea sp.]|nr:DinB family protein [Chryseolinea sp.]